MGHQLVAGRIQQWAEDQRRQLTLVLSEADDAANAEAALILPNLIYDKQIPVWVRMHKDLLSLTAAQNPRLKNLIPFGMDDCGYDVRLPAVKMSKLLHYFYLNCGEGVPTFFPEQEVEKQWRQIDLFKMRLTNVWNVMTMATKMHSLGHNTDDLSTFYALSAEETEDLTRTEHNRWCVERLISGTRPCTDAERAEIDADISLKNVYKKERDAHYDLCAYDNLGTDAKGNDVRIYDRALTECIPLIVKYFLNTEDI